MLYDRYGRPVYSLVLGLLREPAIAEEVTQEVFLRIWLRASSFKPESGKAKTWILSIAHHRAIDKLRQQRHRQKESPLEDFLEGEWQMGTEQGAVEHTAILQEESDRNETEDGSRSNGSGLGLFVGKTNLGLIRRGLVAFDLTDTIPEGATITDVTLRLHVSKTSSGAQSVELHTALADWGEGASDANANEGSGVAAESGDATWLHTFFDADAWASPGGDFAESASAATKVDGRGDYSWGGSDGLIAVVQAWVDDPASNFGWVVTGNEVDNKATKRFNTKESADGVDGPALTITYTIPPEATPAPVPPSAPAPTATPTPTPAPTATPAPSAGRGDGTGVQDTVEIVRTINVMVLEFSITPSVISIQAGEKVQFNVTNGGSVFHTFTFDLSGQRVSIDLLAGETGTTEVLTFGEAPQIRFFCQPHEFVPMVGVINVSNGG